MRVSLADTLVFLNEKFADGVRDITSIGGGAWSDAFSYVHEDTKYVIRWSDHAENFERDALAATYSRDGLPIPDILDLGREDDYYYAISPFVEGSFFEQLSETELEKSLPSIRAMFAALRAVDLSNRTGYGTWDGTGNGQYGSWRAFLLDIRNDQPGSLIHGWRENLAASSLGTESFDHLYNLLAATVDACPERRQLIHSDLINRNVLIHDGQVRAVLDWGSSTYGDALFDIAWILFWEAWYPNFQASELSSHLLDDYRSDPASDTVNLERRLYCYLLHIGLDSISYNAFRRDWSNAKDAAARATALVSRFQPGG